MATKTRGALVVAVIAVGAVLTFGVDGVIDGAKDVIGSVTGDTEFLGEGENRVLIAGDANSQAKRCTTEEMINQRKCADISVLVVDANRMPFIARNTELAWESGRPGILTMNRAKQDANRRAVCPRNFPKPHGGQCDEYPMAVTEEGGAHARAEEVPGRENACQGGMYGAQYPKKDGEKFLVVIVHPEQIATTPFAGVDMAKDQGWC